MTLTLSELEQYLAKAAWLLRLARWRFSSPPKYKYVEERMGCIVYFRKVEI